MDNPLDLFCSSGSLTLQTAIKEKSVVLGMNKLISSSTQKWDWQLKKKLLKISTNTWFFHFFISEADEKDDTGHNIQKKIINKRMQKYSD